MQSLRELYKIGKGPSSSHTMGPDRAARQFLTVCPQAERYRAVLYGSLARTGRGHLTDEAISAVFAPRETEIVFDCDKTDLPHPNTFDLFGLDGDGNVLAQKTYLSVGGGTVCGLGETLPPEQEVYPFKNFSEIHDYCTKNNLTLAQLVWQMEDADFPAYLRHVWNVMQETIDLGLNRGGELPGTLHVQRKAAILNQTVAGESETERDKRIVCAYAFATAEENASGGTIVTAPTCGASGVLPAVLRFFVGKYGFSAKKILDALAVAGLIGNVVKTNASVSGAEAGCQAEIGTATSMAAAAVCTLFGNTIDMVEYAAEIGLEHQLGLTCDPIHGYVQIPCIERNAVAALRALDSAELAHILSGSRKISFDLIVHTMYETGKDIHERYRETSEGGLAAHYKFC